MPRSTVTSKGQVTIPQSIRTRLGLHTGDVIEFVEGPDGAILGPYFFGGRLGRSSTRLARALPG
jgi:AbrB family looped-hinge helix DNA binding protein